METILSTEKAQRDYQLVCMAREKGDQQAFADLMRRYKEPVYTMLLKMTNNPLDADDLTIEAFGKAFCQLHLYTPTNAFSTWLFAIASNNCLDHIRKQRMRTVPLSDMSSHGEDEIYEYPLPADTPTPEEKLVREQRANNIRKAVDMLKPIYRDLLQLRYFEELSYEEIAQKLEMPMGTVKIRIKRRLRRAGVCGSHAQYRRGL